MNLKAAYADVLSQETISYQGGKSLLFFDLSTALQRFIEDGKMSQLDMDKLNLDRIIKKHTGLTVDVKLQLHLVNAFAVPPVIDPNGPLLDRFRAMGATRVEDFGDFMIGFKKICALSDELRGEIDLGKGRVSGVFANLPTVLTLGSGLWEDLKLSGEEVAAIALHELGHVFTFFESLMQTVTTNMVLNSASQALAKTTDMSHRLNLVFETQKATGVKLENPEAVAKPGMKEDAFCAVFIKAKMDPSLRSATGSSSYDLRSSEFVADQFAARYGAGRALVTALDKLYTKSGAFGGLLGAPHRRSTATWFIIESLKTAVYILSIMQLNIRMIALLLMYMVVSNPEARVYDDPGERLTRVRTDMVQSLKDQNLSEKTRAALAADIKVIDTITDGIHDRRELLNYIWIALTSKRREQFSQMRFQQELERLVNNDFFVKAQQLKNLT